VLLTTTDEVVSWSGSAAYSQGSTRQSQIVGVGESTCTFSYQGALAAWAVVTGYWSIGRRTAVSG